MQAEMSRSTLHRDRTMGLSILAAAFLGSLCISWWASVVSGPEPSLEPPPPTPVGVTGFPDAVDAVATLPAARGLTQRDDLHGIIVEGVRSDGTVDFGKLGARIQYAFQSARGEGPQPPRPKGTLPQRSYCGKQGIRVTQEGLVAEPDQPAATCRAGDQALPDPRCGPKEVWRYAIGNKKVPESATARIEYYRSKAGPAWRFELAGGRNRFALYGDCEVELGTREAAGSTP
jgi:hypothetical protein